MVVAAIKGNILYKIYYKSYLVYIGRTKQDLTQRIRGHFFKKAMHKNIDIFKTSKIEYAKFKSEADMFVYEVYLINLYKPPINVDDKASDNLSVTLPNVDWVEFDCHLMAKWRDILSERKKGN
jgi:hypothetical protein